MPDLAEVGVVADVFAKNDLAVGVDSDVVKHLLPLGAVEQQLDGSAGGRVAGVVEVHRPEPARQIEAIRRDEVEAVGIDCIPCPVFRTKERRHARGFACRIELGAGHAACVTEVDHREGGLFVGTERRSGGRLVVARHAFEFGHVNAEHMTAGQARLFHSVAGRLLVTGVEVDLAVQPVVGDGNHGLVAGVRVGDHVLVGHVTEPGEFIAVAVLRPADDVGECPSLGTGFLAVKVQPSLKPRPVLAL